MTISGINVSGCDDLNDALAKLAHDVLTETLHGPVPMHTIAALAEGVLAVSAAAEEMARDHLDRADKADDRVRVLEEMLRADRERWIDLGYASIKGQLDADTIEGHVAKAVRRIDYALAGIDDPLSPTAEPTPENT